MKRRIHFVTLSLVAASLAVNTSSRDINAVPVTTVSAASFEPTAVSPDSIVAAFGTQLATQTAIGADADPSQPGIQLPTELAGTTVEVNGHRAGLFFVSGGQINFVMPSATETGSANIVVRAGDGTISNGVTQIAQVAPSIFTANANGRGVPAAVLLRVRANGLQTTEPVSRFDASAGRFVTVPIDLGPTGDRVFLVMFLTGIRRAQDTNGDGNLNESVRVLLGGDATTPLFAGRQPDFVGLDQVNLEIPRSLSGRGIVNLSINAPGFTTSNLVEIEVGGGGGTSPPQITGFGGAPALAGQELLINGGGFAPAATDNIVRIAGLDAQVMSATPSQLRVLVPFGVQTGTVSVRTPGGEMVSSAALPVRTSISGLVENTSRQPMNNVDVRITGTSISVKTNTEGAFVLPDAPIGPQFVEVDGGSLGVNPPYPKVTLKITTQSSRDNQFARAIALQQATGAGGTIGTGSSLAAGETTSEESDLQSQQTIVIQTGGFQLDVPASSTATFPSGSLRDRIILTPLLGARTPVNLPFGYFSASAVQITPFNVRIGLGAKLTFPNSESLPTGTKVELFRYDSQEGSFVRENETATVSPDGRRIETSPSAIKITNIYFAAVFRRTTTVTGRVLERDGRPVPRALARLRGQEARTDGTGTYVLRYVPATAGESLSVEISSIRSQRVDRILSASAMAVLGGITKIPDLILPGERDNRPPAIVAPDRLELEEGKSFDTTVVINDPDAGQSVEASVSGVSFATLTPRGAGSAYVLRLSPDYQQAGERTLTLTATDSAGASAKHEIALVIKDVNRPPSATSQSVTVDQNGQVSIRLEGTDPDGDPLTYKLLTQPARGTLTGAPPSLTYRPNANYAGSDGFTFRTSDGSLESDTATVSITVRSTNRAPMVTVPGPQSTTENKPVSFNSNRTNSNAAGQTAVPRKRRDRGRSRVQAD